MKRKFIDENGRFFGKVSFIDVLVLLVVAVVVITALTKQEVVVSTTGSVATVPVEYVVVVRNTRESMARMYQEGDSLWLDSGVYAGEIVGVEFDTPAKAPSQTIDGTYVMGEYESKYDVYLTVLADCSHSNGRYYADRTFELNVNQEKHFQTKYMTLTARLLEINPQ